MSSPWTHACRWLKGTSNRTFVLWPLALLAWRALWDGGWPHVNAWGLPLLACGYAQYKLVGRLRTERGGGGPGMSRPPERLVTDGPYRFVRNPMYLGHLVFFLGLAIVFSGVAWVLFAGHLVWFDRRAREDEAHLRAQFGHEYDLYRARVKRWLPGVY